MKIQWRKIRAGLYESSCGRFSIRKREAYEMHGTADRSFGWVMHDNQQAEFDGSPWSRHYMSLAVAQNNAQRILDTGKAIGAAGPAHGRGSN
jgi:hypothetical protein